MATEEGSSGTPDRAVRLAGVRAAVRPTSPVIFPRGRDGSGSPAARWHPFVRIMDLPADHPRLTTASGPDRTTHSDALTSYRLGSVTRFPPADEEHHLRWPMHRAGTGRGRLDVAVCRLMSSAGCRVG